MTSSGHAHTTPARRWMFLVSFLLIGCLMQAVMAQDAATDVPTAIPTITLAEMTLMPTDLLPPTSEPTQPPALEATIQPSADVSATAASEAMLPATPLPGTPLPSETAMPTALVPAATDIVEPTSAPTGLPQTTASITVASSAVNPPENTILSLTFAAQDLTNVSMLVLACQADPAVLLGTQGTRGALLTADPVVVTDGGFQADGQWRLTVQASSDAAFSGSGALWSLNYRVIAPGVTQIVCAAQVSDRLGTPLPLAAAQMALMIEATQAIVPVTPTVEVTADLTLIPPTVMLTETPALTATIESISEYTPTSEATQVVGEIMLTLEVTAEASPTIEHTQESTALAPTLEVTAEASSTVKMTETPASPAALTVPTRLSGSVVGAQPVMQAVVTIRGANTQKTVVVQEDGSFAIDITPGSYQITFSAPHYLPYTLEGLIAGEIVTLSPITLVDGDVDGNGVIDEADAALVIADFGLNVLPGAGGADLNGDQVVNIYDLAIVSANAHL